jgi:hypothetical protein
VGAYERAGVTVSYAIAANENDEDNAMSDMLCEESQRLFSGNGKADLNRKPKNARACMESISNQSQISDLSHQH